MSPQSSAFRNLQLSTVFVNTFAAGLNLSLSFFVIPRLLESPTPLMLRQFKNMFRWSSRAFPFPVIACAISYWYMAYAFRHIPAKSRLFTAAGALCVTIVPWTKFVIHDINRKLFQKAEETKDMGIMAVGLTQEEEEGAKYLVDQWGLWNLGRNVGVTLGSALGLYAITS
ncbi:Monooxygenase hypC [Colletotrichum spinosum]|uniref:Monooxygenase hypC n=1 Tax=Colletotrichum spinosum TaxID=1347390 RepID=A0A4V3HSP0_9PEZI|nr:Monooxygenase hypC [Colletotrichum spinosum]